VNLTITLPLGFGGTIVEATFVARPNRFLVEAVLDGTLVQAHLADRGRLKETLVPGARLLLAHRPAPGRKTAFQAVAAYRGEQLASLDTHLPTRLVLAALRAGALPRFAGYRSIRPEATVGASRFDVLLEGETGRCVLEVKSAGDLCNGVARFPDAPTTRGRRHLEELAALAQAGTRAAVVFIAQGQARAVHMHTAIDPEFAAQLTRSAEAGVEVLAYACPLAREGIVLGAEIPVGLMR
jgi:sugar fermentation stimulation protein A